MRSLWLGDFKKGLDQPEIPLAKEKAKVECEGHLLVKFCSQNKMSAQSNHFTWAD
jgi:hypothetical protein